MSEPIGRFLIVDYDRSRVDDVRRMSTYARESYGTAVTLVRADPTSVDAGLCDEVIDLDPLRPDFADAAERLLGPRRDQFVAGVVFSDDAVRSGAELLARLGLRTDSPELAAGAACKHAYRRSEAAHRKLLTAQRLLVPDVARVDSCEGLADFARWHPEGFVVKPAREGDNRGVVVVGPGDCVDAAFAEVGPYVENGVICEELLPYRREYSFDGLGSLSFVTEKVRAAGRYPVELAQILPARLDHAGRSAVERAGRQVNWLVGQCEGPFHHEIRLSDDGSRTAVVAPHRRPAGMKIWDLAYWVYGVDLHQRWVDAAFGNTAGPALSAPACSAATVMLGVKTDRDFAPEDVVAGPSPLEYAVAATAAAHRLLPGELVVTGFDWLSPARRRLHATPRDGADFAAQGCVVLTAPGTDMGEIVRTLREVWLDTLDACTGRFPAPAQVPAQVRGEHDAETETELEPEARAQVPVMGGAGR
ncbi:acetyl-CoA carboxylase biotin carboxylase subunit family protein [Streptomyces sp. NPDC053493]|uniref:acetyl-CoA carboxylase biotin carboxylase subunit family protein n=1 Tax=Streptomyces sp. NPDC053493 TaxID=3365705 RepID=UPI0037D10661